MPPFAICPPHTAAHLRRHLRLAAAAALLGLSGCAALPPPAVVDFAQARDTLAPAPVPVPMAPQRNGAIFQAASYRPAFEDSRARLVGDIITIQIAEALTASQVTSSSMNRDTNSSNSITPPLPGILSTDLLNLNMANATKNDFTGKGDSEAAHSFSGSISARVIEVLPNGNLVVAGEKQIGVNQNVDVMRFTGTVDPRLLQPNNIISSLQVADVRVESKQRGALGEAHTVGWLSRFFLNFNPF